MQMGIQEAFNRTGKNVAVGLVSGFIATLPMTLALFGLRQFHFIEKKKTSPPKKITRRLMKKVLNVRVKNEMELDAISSLMHFGYGASAAVPYAVLHQKLNPRVPHVLSGAVYGLGVWAASYIGWLPYFNIMSKPQDANRGRNLSLVGSHLIWGACVGGLCHLLEDRDSNDV